MKEHDELLYLIAENLTEHPEKCMELVKEFNNLITNNSDCDCRMLEDIFSVAIAMFTEHKVETNSSEGLLYADILLKFGKIVLSLLRKKLIPKNSYAIWESKCVELLSLGTKMKAKDLIFKEENASTIWWKAKKVLMKVLVFVNAKTMKTTFILPLFDSLMKRVPSPLDRFDSLRATSLSLIINLFPSTQFLRTLLFEYAFPLVVLRDDQTELMEHFDFNNHLKEMVKNYFNVIVRKYDFTKEFGEFLIGIVTRY